VLRTVLYWARNAFNVSCWLAADESGGLPEEPRLTDDQRAITRLKVSLISFARRNGLALPAWVHTIGNGK
jgi:hypothetical protein